jgi:hypothetical protein
LYDESAGVLRGSIFFGCASNSGGYGYLLTDPFPDATHVGEQDQEVHLLGSSEHMQICTTLMATFASMIGLFASGEWKSLKHEMDMFKCDQFSYLMTLVWSSLSWQVASLGMVDLIFQVSLLFSNVIGTFAIPIIPFFGMMVFHDKMNGVKIIAMLVSIWGFVSYVYHHYLEDKKARKASA